VIVLKDSVKHELKMTAFSNVRFLKKKKVKKRFGTRKQHFKK